MSYEPERINGEDSVAEGFEKTNRNNWNLKTILNEWFNRITKEFENKANKTDIPTSLPANGGNANFLRGKAPSDFIETTGGAMNGNLEIKVQSSNAQLSIERVGTSVGKVWMGAVESNGADALVIMNRQYKPMFDIISKDGTAGVYKDGTRRAIAIADGTIQINLNANMVEGKNASYFARSGYGGGGEVSCSLPSGVDILCITNSMGQFINGNFMGYNLKNAPSEAWYFIKQIVHNNDWVNLQILSFTDPNAKWLENRKILGTWQGWKEL